tara:strand:- start:983 stop:1699 length:717 start_codon:yes stop_codon:yes gene_type:complete
MLSSSDIKRINKLHHKVNRKKIGQFIVEGDKCVKELLLSSFNVIELYAVKDWKNTVDNTQVKHVSSSKLQRISGFKKANKVIAIANISDCIHDFKHDITLVLDDISDPGNLGTIIRLADWYSIKGIVCSENSVDMYNNKVIQSSMGSIFRVNLMYKNLSSYLSNVNTNIYGAFKTGNNIRSNKFDKDCHLILGNESRGISEDLKIYIDENISIKKFGNEIDSLNVAVSAGIILHEFTS